MRPVPRYDRSVVADRLALWLADYYGSTPARALALVAPYNAKRRGEPPVEVPTKYDITADAVNAFVDGARTGKIENAAFTAAESTMTAILGRMAAYSGKEIEWAKALASKYG